MKTMDSSLEWYNRFKVTHFVPSPRILFPPKEANYIHGPCPLLHKVCIPWMGIFTHTALLDKVNTIIFSLASFYYSFLTFHFPPSLLLFNFYCCFQATCSSALPTCMPPPLPQPHCTLVHNPLSFLAFLHALSSCIHISSFLWPRHFCEC